MMLSARATVASQPGRSGSPSTSWTPYATVSHAGTAARVFGRVVPFGARVAGLGTPIAYPDLDDHFKLCNEAVRNRTAMDNETYENFFDQARRGGTSREALDAFEAEARARQDLKGMFRS